MLLAGYVTAKGKNFKVRSSDNREFTAKIHWAPPFAPNTAIVKALDPYGEVKTICFEKCKSQGFESVCSGIRSVVMTGDRRKVPHLITVTNPVTADKYELLVTIAGRPPLCLKCRQTGHYRRACKTPFCRHHGVYGHTTESCALDKATYATAMRKTKEGSDDTDSEENEVTPRDHEGRSATVRDPASGALSAARRPGAQDNAPTNTPDNDLNDKVRKAVWAMTDEERLAFRKAAKDLEKFVKTKRAYRPPPRAAVAGSDKAPRTRGPDSIQAKVLETPPVTETDGGGTGVVDVSDRAEVPQALPVTETDGDGTGVVAPRQAGVDMATAATPGTGVASEETPSVTAPPSVVGVIVTPPAADTVADSVPATPLPPPDRSCSSRHRSYATVAAPSSDDMSSDEVPRPQWNLVKRRKKRKMTEMSPSNTVSDSSPKSGGLLIVTDSSFETY